jgi:hypothetical protein
LNYESKITSCQVLVVHAYNPSYSGGRDQEDLGSKPAQANSSRDPILKISITKSTGGVAQGVGPEFKPQYYKKKITSCLERDHFVHSSDTSFVCGFRLSQKSLEPHLLVLGLQERRVCRGVGRKVLQLLSPLGSSPTTHSQSLSCVFAHCDCSTPIGHPH